MRHPLGILRNSQRWGGETLKVGALFLYQQVRRARGEDSVSRNVKMTSFVFQVVEPVHTG